ncbi:putative Secreted Protein [Cryptosporidium felis]|nr:putative Secreted Protein [Cryptosporidium felis]
MKVIFSLIITFGLLSSTISKKGSEKKYNPDTILVGIDNKQNPQIYNSQYRIRVRKLDPFLRTVLIKGIEPNFPNDINADGKDLSSENRYSNLPIKLHVPIIPIEKSVKIRRMPVITQSPDRLPLEATERLFSFAINICKLPSLWYIELSYCMHKGVTKFTTGILTSYTLQDIIGASLASMDLPSESFSLTKCKYSVSQFSDIAINKKGPEVCNIMLTCLTSKEFVSTNKRNMRRLEKEISNIYKNKPPFFRGQQPRSYAQKIIVGLLIARRLNPFEGERGKLKNKKRTFFPDKLFYIIRYFNFIMVLTEYLINNGFKDVDAFEVSPRAYLKLCDKSLLKPSPLKMIAGCSKLLINAHMANNSVDYLPYISKATWSPFSNAIIQHACTELVSIGFVNSEIEIPKNVSIFELQYLAYPHLAHSKQNLEQVGSKEVTKIRPKPSAKKPATGTKAVSPKPKKPGEKTVNTRLAPNKLATPKHLRNTTRIISDLQISETGAISTPNGTSEEPMEKELKTPILNQTHKHPHSPERNQTHKHPHSPERNQTHEHPHSPERNQSQTNLKKEIEDILSGIDIDLD